MSVPRAFRFDMRRDNCWNRKSHGERAAFTFTGAFSEHRSPMRMHEFTDNGEAQTESSVTPACCALCLPETVEYVREEIIGDTIAVINNLNARLRSCAGQSNLDMAATRRELDCICQKIRKDLLQPAGIPNEHDFVPCCDLQRYAFGVGRRP